MGNLDILLTFTGFQDPYAIGLIGEEEQSGPILSLVGARSFVGPEHNHFQEINRVYQALSSFRVPNDVLLYSSDEFAKGSQSLNHVVGRCSRDGKLLWCNDNRQISPTSGFDAIRDAVPL